MQQIMVALVAVVLAKAQQILGPALQVRAIRAGQLLVLMRGQAVVAVQAQLEVTVLGQ
jgi:hypothetical protein